MTAPLRHPFLDHLDRAADLEAAHPQPLWTPGDGALPSLYISHGAPPVFEDPAWMQQLHGWARALPKPRAVLIVSAHWESAPLSITSTQPTELVYDFGGFDPMYYRMRYDTRTPASWPAWWSACCRTPRPSTSTAPAGSTTGRGC